MAKALLSRRKLLVGTAVAGLTAVSTPAAAQFFNRRNTTPTLDGCEDGLAIRPGSGQKLDQNGSLETLLRSRGLQSGRPRLLYFTTPYENPACGDSLENLAKIRDHAQTPNLDVIVIYGQEDLGLGRENEQKMKDLSLYRLSASLTEITPIAKNHGVFFRNTDRQDIDPTNPEPVIFHTQNFFLIDTDGLHISSFDPNYGGEFLERMAAHIRFKLGQTDGQTPAVCLG